VRRRTLLAAATVAIVAGCGGDGTGPNTGTFTATVTGDLSMTLTGEAVFGTQTDSTGTSFGVALIRGDPNSFNSDIIVIGRANEARPASGTYDIVATPCGTCTEDDFDAALAIVRPSDFGAYLSESGTLTITSSTADRLEGSATVTMSAFFQFQGAQTVTIELTFSAVPGALPSGG
jgi:hypothetical protein